MAVNLLEEDRLVYHDENGDTFEITTLSNCPGEMNFTCIDNYRDWEIQVIVRHDAVETLRDSLTCWLETGKLKQPTELQLEAMSDAQLAFERDYDGDL